ncbi:hypothetical protein AgCh_017351 [Apium graveolens]
MGITRSGISKAVASECCGGSTIKASLALFALLDKDSTRYLSYLLLVRPPIIATYHRRAKKIKELKVKIVQSLNNWYQIQVIKVFCVVVNGRYKNGRKTGQCRAEQYFEVQNTKPEHKAKLAFIAMEGVAVHWLKWLRGKSPGIQWDDLATELMRRFGGSKAGNPYEKLAELRQDSTVEEYIQAFEYVAGMILGLPEQAYVGNFINGLKENIKRRLRVHDPQELVRTMELARDIEDELAEGNPTQVGSQSHRPVFPSNPIPPKAGYMVTKPTSAVVHKGDIRVKSVPQLSATAATSNQQPYRSNRGNLNISPAEMRARHARNQCFSFEGQFSPGHVCPNAHLRVMIAAENPEDELPADKVDEDDIHTSISHVECHTMELHLYSTAGITRPSTMKMQGFVQKCPIVILIDSGASHNFILADLVRNMGLPVTPTNEFGVKLGDGHTVPCNGVCRAVKMRVGDLHITADCYPFQLGGVDLILGIAWLETLGEVKVNWQKMTMTFDADGCLRRLQGNPSLSTSVVSLKSILNTADADTCFMLWAMSAVEPKHSNIQHLTELQQQSLHMLLEQYDVVFQESVGLPPQRDRSHAITLKPGVTTINVRPYRYAHSEKNEIERLVQEMLGAGIIQPSSSPFSSPVILVKKKDGSWRFCVDYRALNDATIPDKYPIPIINELLDELGGASYFSKIDLKSGYHQIRIQPKDIPKIAFRTHDGHYEFLVLPFGLTNGPATFQSVMNDLFRPYLRKFVLVFFDDILIYSRDWESHMEHMRIVLEILRSQQFFANKKKSAFGQQQVEYLGHVISATGVAMDPSKLKDVEKWPEPRSVKAVRGFLGLTGYYRKFIRDYGKIARPLTNVLKKDSFHWTSETHQAFEQLKRALVTGPVLAMPNFSKPFLVECDASGKGIGAVLIQDSRPIAYFSKAISDRALSKSTYEKELLALVSAVHHWRPYLLGRQFIIRTDHKSLKHLLTQRISTPDQQKWLSRLLGYTFDIVYKPGTENNAADALSRRDDDSELALKATDAMELSAISRPQWSDTPALATAVRSDTYLSKIVQALESNQPTLSGYTLAHGQLLYKGRLVIPATSEWVSQFIQEFHSTPTGGHSGFLRTYKRISSNLFWNGMKADIMKYVAECTICQQHKYQATSPAGLLQPLALPTAVWEDISLDFISGLPRSQGYDTLLVVIDRFSKYGHFVLLKHPYTAKKVVEVYAKEIARLHGIPRSIVSDRDPTFLSQFWTEFFKLQGTTLRMSSSYHPETDGQTEVLNRCVETYLRYFASDQPKQWSRWVHWAEYWYNTSFQSATKMTPFQVVYNRPPPTILKFLKGEIAVEAVAQELEDRDEILRQLKYNLEHAQHRMKKQADLKRRDYSFAVGDWVYLKLRPYRQQSIARRIHPKLSARFYGPFEIIAKIGSVAYHLQLPEGSRVHPVFHVSLLKKALGHGLQPGHLPAGLEVELPPTAEPQFVLAYRDIVHDDQSTPQILVQWKGQSQDEATWEDVNTIKEQFPLFRLGDKATLEEGGIVRPPIIATYHRRAKKIKELKVYQRRKKKGNMVET